MTEPSSGAPVPPRSDDATPLDRLRSSEQLPPPNPDNTQRTKGARMMVGGITLAVLAPLFGFLAGSMLGPARQFGDYDAMFLSMFIGLVIGGVGALIGGLGLLKFARDDAEEPWHF